MKSDEQIKIVVLVFVMLASLALFDNASDYMHTQLTGAAVFAQSDSTIEIKVNTNDDGVVISAEPVTFTATATGEFDKILLYVRKPGNRGYEIIRCDSSPCEAVRGPYAAGEEIRYYAITFDENSNRIETTIVKKFDGGVEAPIGGAVSTTSPTVTIQPAISININPTNPTTTTRVGKVQITASAGSIKVSKIKIFYRRGGGTLFKKLCPERVCYINLLSKVDQKVNYYAVSYDAKDKELARTPISDYTILKKSATTTKPDTTTSPVITTKPAVSIDIFPKNPTTTTRVGKVQITASAGSIKVNKIKIFYRKGGSGTLFKRSCTARVCYINLLSKVDQKVNYYAVSYDAKNKELARTPTSDYTILKESTSAT